MKNGNHVPSNEFQQTKGKKQYPHGTMVIGNVGDQAFAQMQLGGMRLQILHENSMVSHAQEGNHEIDKRK
jgi:hypothetical protein